MYLYFKGCFVQYVLSDFTNPDDCLHKMGYDSMRDWIDCHDVFDDWQPDDFVVSPRQLYSREEVFI